MISFEEARQIALARIGPNCGLVESATIAKPYGWYFYGQTRAYLETGNVMESLVGSGGFIVERADGRIFEFGSAYSVEQWLANYEKGFKYDGYDLTVLAVFDTEVAIGLLARLDMRYVVPEEHDGTVWVIPRPYKRDRLRDMLGRLPCTFADQMFWHRVDVFDQINASGCCKYELREHIAQAEPGTQRDGAAS